MKKFSMLCESLLTLKQTKTIRYPKQITLSEEFISALKKEIRRFDAISESKEPVRDFENKFLKALTFHIKEHCGHCGAKGKVIMKKKKKIGPVVQGQTTMEYGTSKVTGGL
jgi:hypothetical protein